MKPVTRRLFRDFQVGAGAKVIRPSSPFPGTLTVSWIRNGAAILELAHIWEDSATGRAPHTTPQ